MPLARSPHAGPVVANGGPAAGLTDTGPALVQPIERELNTHVTRRSCGRPKVLMAALGDTGTALGAIALLQQQSSMAPRG